MIAKRKIPAVFLFCLIPFFLTAQDAVILDGQFSDWQQSTALWAQPNSTAGETQLRAVHARNDARFLYLHIQNGVAFSLQSNNEVTVNIDSDNDKQTGKSLNGIGVDIQFTFGTRSGYVYQNGDSTAIGFSDLFCVTAPTVWSDHFEIAFDRNSTINQQSVFSGDVVSFYFQDQQFKTPVLNYQIDVNPVEHMPDYAITKPKEKFVRLLTQNIHFDGFFEEERKPVFDRLYDAINPDIIAFQEMWNHNEEDVKTRLEEMLPSAEGESWNVARYSGKFLATRYQIVEQYLCDPYDNPAFLLDLNPTYNTKVLILVAHPFCCSKDSLRQREFDSIAAFIRDIKNPNDARFIGHGTPIIITGDMNLVGNPRQLQTLLTGDIYNEAEFGADLTPDWDGSDFIDAAPLTTHLPMSFTYGNAHGPRRYGKGKLDYIVYTGSVLSLENTFVFYTNALPDDSLQHYNVQKTDTEASSDHFPVVADFSYTPFNNTSTIETIRINDDQGVPQNIGQAVTVSGIVSAKFGYNGPAFMQDNTAGMAIYGQPLFSDISVGDSLVIRAKLTQFRGLTELVHDSSITAISILKKNLSLTANTVTVADINNQEWNGLEVYESTLCKLENVWFIEQGTFSGNTNYSLTDGIDTMRVRIQNGIDIVGQSIPSGAVNITGTVSQFAYSAPYNKGYQLFPRSSNDLEAFSGIVETGNKPGQFRLYQNYPNPFNPETQIFFDLPKAELVSLKVYSIEGKEVASLINTYLPAGQHFARFDGSALGSGVYYYILKAGKQKAVSKMTLIR